MSGHYIGRLFWDDGHPSPWMSFENQTAFQKWRAAIRRARPDTKTEGHPCDFIWTASAMLAGVETEAREDKQMHITDYNTDALRITVGSGGGGGGGYAGGGGTGGLILRRVEPRSRKQRLADQIDALEAELARLAALPDEPEIDEDEPNVVWFVKTFGDGQDYTYAAVKAGDGLWYTTGPKSPKGYTWEQLTQWAFDGDEGLQVWSASEWTPL